MSTTASRPKRRQLKTLPLTIFLLKQGTNENGAVDSLATQGARTFPVVLDDKPLGTLHVKQNRDHRPAWASFFDGSVELERRDLRIASVSALFLIRTSSRLFALTFGHGRHLLNEAAIEERFGLHTTLNSVDPEVLRGVDTTTLDANPLHGKRQPARAAPLDQFGLNIDQDVLRAVTGSPIDKSLGSQMTGRDSLSVRVRTDLHGLRRLLGRYLEKSKEDTYKKNGFSWVDHVSEVRDPDLQHRLFSQVVDQLGTAEHLWAAIPEVVDWTAFDHFRFGTPNSSITHDDVTLDYLLEALKDEPPTFDLLKTRRVYCMTKDSPYPVMEWSFLKCLSAEVPHDGCRYLLNAGTWFKIDPDFTKRVEEEIREIPEMTLSLGAWGNENESEYNSRIAGKSAGNLALMDKVMIRYDGMPTPIEFCDLYSQTGEMVHVKRYGQSSVLSHLFAQGTVAAEAALADASFRKAANAKLPATHQFVNPEDRIDPSKYEVCFAIGSSRTGRLRLPFFSQVTLRNAYRRLHRSLGFRVSFTKIDVSKLTNIAAAPSVARPRTRQPYLHRPTASNRPKLAR